MTRLALALAFVLASAATAQAIETERVPPFDFASACSLAVPATCAASEHASVAPGAYADVGGRLVSTAASTGTRAWAVTGFRFTVPAGTTLAATADVTLRGAGTFKACIDLGGQVAEPVAPRCQSRDGTWTLSGSISAPPGEALTADPRVRLVGAEDCAIGCFGTAVAEVRRFTYRVLR